MNFDLKDRVVLMTGATGGLGRELTRLLHERGARLVLTGRHYDALLELIESLPDPTRAKALDADLTKPGAGERLAALAMEAYGQIDVLVNNAGMGYFATMEQATEERIRQVFELNMFTPLLLSKVLLPHMTEKGEGRIVNIVSSAGRVPIPTVGVYGGSKSALAIMANTMRLELQSGPVKVINIYPGTVQTAFEKNALREETRSGLSVNASSGRPPEVAAALIVDGICGEAGELWLEREGRWMAGAAILWPSLVERRLAPLAKRVLTPADEPKAPELRRWKLWQVESSFACNLQCVMCPWQQMRLELGDSGLMSDEIWQAVEAQLPEIQSIDFSGGGEPLLLPNLAERISQAKAAGCEAGFLTNGSLLNEKRAREMLEAGVDWISFSLDGADRETYESIRKGANFNRVTENILRMSRLRVGRSPRIAIQFVIMKSNMHQLDEIVQLAKRLGVEQVTFKQCDVIRGQYGDQLGVFDIRETDQLKRLNKALMRARKRARRLGIETAAFSFTPDEQSVCDQDPRRSWFVRYDGFVAPCINLAYGGETSFLGESAMMPTVHYGRLPDDSALKLWESERSLLYRERFEKRVKIYDQKLVDAGFETSLHRLEEAFEKARAAMPEPPEGCRFCHYLYDI